MAEPNAIARTQIDEHAAKLNAIASSAASIILEARVEAIRELNAAKDEAANSVRMIGRAIERYERQKVDFSSLSDKAAAIQAGLESIEERLGLNESHADELLGLVGQVVRIKSNPDVPMTAAAVGEDGRILCVWMDGDGYMEASIPFAALEVVDQEGGAK